MSKKPLTLTDNDYEEHANFRYTLRRFLEFSQGAAASEGLTPQQHQSLLVIRASAGQKATVGRLADRLLVKHHTAVELAQRLEAAGLITRETSKTDRRVVLLSLTDEGAARLERIVTINRGELKNLAPELTRLFSILPNA